MGYRRTGTTFNLHFEDPALNGLEVKVRSLSIGKLLELSELASLADGDELTPDDLKRIDPLFTTLADSLVGWNYEDENGDPIPATLESIKGEELGFVLQIVTAWMNAVASVSGPLANGSTGGGPSPAPLLPMVALSPSLAS